MRYCTRCSMYNKEGARFCAECGQPLGRRHATIVAGAAACILPVAVASSILPLEKSVGAVGTCEAHAQVTTQEVMLAGSEIDGTNMRGGRSDGNVEKIEAKNIPTSKDGSLPKSKDKPKEVTMPKSAPLPKGLSLPKDSTASKGPSNKGNESKDGGDKGSGSKDGGNKSGSDKSGSDKSGSNKGGTNKGSDSKVSDKADNPRKNAGLSSRIGNLINGGHMASDESGYLYYAAPIDGTEWDTRIIVRCERDGSDKTIVYEAPKDTINVYHLSVIGNQLIFNQISDGASVVKRVDLNNGRNYTLDRCDDWSLCQVDNGWVYYLYDGTIHRRDVDGNDMATLMEVGRGQMWRVLGENVYTMVEDGGTVVRRSGLDGSGTRVVYRTSDGYVLRNAFPISGNRLVTFEQKSGGEKCRVRIANLIDGTERTLYSGPDVIRVTTTNSGVIIVVSEGNGDYRMFEVDMNGHVRDFDETVSVDGGVRYTSWLDGMLLFGVVDDDLSCSVRSVDTVNGKMRTIEK